MLEKLLHHRLLTHGLEGQGVVTAQSVEGMKGTTGAGGFYLGIEGHMKFDDGTEGKFASKLLDTSKVGELDVGTIVPVRYDAAHKHVLLDVPKLEASKAAETQEAVAALERSQAEKIAAADDALTRGG